MANSVREAYYYVDYPYISKSSYKKWKSCKYQFKRTIMDGLKTTGNYIMARGTSLHHIYYKFFDLVDFDFLLTLDWSTDNGTTRSAVYIYFYSLILQYLGKNDKERIRNTHFNLNIKSFCMFEENHWTSLRVSVRDMKDIRRYFMSGINEREKNTRHEGLMIFGTMDRIMHEDGVTVICDYKTGKVPAGIKGEVKVGVYSRELGGRYTMEGNFYVLLYLTAVLHYDIGYDSKGRVQIEKDGKECNKVLKKFDYAFIFTGDFQRGRPRYYVGRKRASIVSIRTIVKNLHDIRTWDDWYREPNIIKCQYCPIYLSDCKGKIPVEIYGDVFSSESTAQKSFYKPQ